MQSFYSSSSFISKVEYNSQNEIMTLYFKNGYIYIYDFVPSEIYSMFKCAKSHGRFYNQNIKGMYKQNV